MKLKLFEKRNLYCVLKKDYEWTNVIFQMFQNYNLVTEVNLENID